MKQLHEFVETFRGASFMNQRVCDIQGTLIRLKEFGFDEKDLQNLLVFKYFSAVHDALPFVNVLITQGIDSASYKEQCDRLRSTLAADRAIFNTIHGDLEAAKLLLAPLIDRASGRSVNDTVRKLVSSIKHMFAELVKDEKIENLLRSLKHIGKMQERM